MAAFPELRAALLFSWLTTALSAAVSSGRQEQYTQNSVCRQNFCVNPIFPGLNDLSLLEQLVWQCSANTQVANYLEFCQGAINYDPALPSPNKTGKPLDTIVKAQDDAASTMFFYHLSGMGYEAWDHPNPSQSDDECVKSVWRMVCFTYFPKAQAGCAAGQASPYQRPCRGPCQQYLMACGVECCDESLQCVFSHQVETGQGTSLLQTGYVDALGPAAECTGHMTGGGSRLGVPAGLLLAILGFHWAANAEASSIDSSRTKTKSKTLPMAGRLTSGLKHFLLVAVVAICSTTLCGCTVGVPYHHTANWRKQPNYLVDYEFVPPGKDTSSAILNSCADPSLPPTAQCSGHGYCKEWNPKNLKSNPVSFCKCDRDWTDPECGTKRKSQTAVFFLSLFGGVFALDYFYLGFPLWGMAKLCSLGGLGFWWLFDIVRTGAGPVYARNYRVANDLPHWIFVLVTISIFMAVGFLYSLDSYLTFRKKKRDTLMKLHESEEARALPSPEQMDGPRFRAPGMAGGPAYGGTPRPYSGYGTTLPGPLPNAGAPFAQY